MADLGRLLEGLRSVCGPLEEGKIFGEKTIAIDLDKFIDGDEDTLLVVGMSGSGKSSLGRHLAREHKAEFIALDACWPFAAADAFDESEKYTACLLKKINGSGKRVVEGIQIAEFFDDPGFEKVLTAPAIIVGKSALKATFDAWKRDKARLPDQMSLFSRWRMNKSLYDLVKAYRKVRTADPEATVEIFSVPDLEVMRGRWTATDMPPEVDFTIPRY